MDWLPLIKDFGIPFALVVFFILETKRREDRMAARLDAVEDFNRTDLTQLVKECTAALNRNSEVMEQVLRKVEIN